MNLYENCINIICVESDEEHFSETKSQYHSLLLR